MVASPWSSVFVLGGGAGASQLPGCVSQLWSCVLRGMELWSCVLRGMEASQLWSCVLRGMEASQLPGL